MRVSTCKINFSPSSQGAGCDASTYPTHMSPVLQSGRQLLLLLAIHGVVRRFPESRRVYRWCLAWWSCRATCAASPRSSPASLANWRSHPARTWICSLVLATARTLARMIPAWVGSVRDNALSVKSLWRLTSASHANQPLSQSTKGPCETSAGAAATSRLRAPDRGSQYATTCLEPSEPWCRGMPRRIAASHLATNAWARHGAPPRARPWS